MPKRPKPADTLPLAPDPAPEPPTADAAAAEPEPAPPADAPPDFEARLAAVEAVVAEQRDVIGRQALELLVATENALQLRESREKVERLKARAEDAKLAASAAKKGYDTAVDEHFDLERELSSGQARLPFRDEAEPEATPAAPTEPLAVVTGGVVLPPASAGDQSWRKVPLGTMGIAEELPHSIVSILGEADLNTIGELSDYLNATAMGRKLTDIAGIGPAKADKIEAALDAFWARWAEWQAHKLEPVAAPAEEAAPEVPASPRAWIVRRAKTGEYLGRLVAEDLDRARAAAEERWSHLDRKAIEVHPAPREDEVETTGEYDLDVALRAEAGPVLPGAEATEDEEDEASEDYEDLGDDEFDDPADEDASDDEEGGDD